jgi:2-polyprenyl-3-methyl-5-hydroxy-6-metoxy-1,4-benzoquinol methylase
MMMRQIKKRKLHPLNSGSMNQIESLNPGLENVEECPVCGGRNFDPYISCRDHLVSQTVFSISCCTSCGLKITTPRPNPADLGKYYESTDYVSHTSEANNLVNRVYKLVRRFTLRGKLSLVNRYASRGSILDVGCGTGDFLTTCKEGGWSVTGIEPGVLAREKASLNTGTPVRSDISELEPGGKFDAITLWHVLEHMPDPGVSIGKLASLLNEGGLMLLALPNPSSADCQHYGEYWAAYDTPRHLYHFSRNQVIQLCANQGLRVEKILPLRLDAFYISLLSEKNKRGSNAYFSATWQGALSTLKAWLSGGEYSSLVYLARKE